MARGTVQRKNYLTCSAGKWREKVDSTTPGATFRHTNPIDGSPGRDVWEIVDDYVEGEIMDIQKTSHDEYGEKWEITIKDGTNKMVLQVRYDSGYAMAMLAKLPNVDITRPVMFLPYFFEEEKKARMVLKQEGMKIPTFFSKEDPKGFPPLAEDASKSDVQRWKLDAMDFLENMVEKEIRPKLPEKDDTEEMSGYEDRKAVDPGDTGGASSSAAEGPGTGDSGPSNVGPGHGDPGPEELNDLPF